MASSKQLFSADFPLCIHKKTDIEKERYLGKEGRNGPGNQAGQDGSRQEAKKGEVCTVEEVLEEQVIFQKRDGNSRMVDLLDFERNFEAAEG